jgi:hypothetical protein
MVSGMAANKFVKRKVGNQVPPAPIECCRQTAASCPDPAKKGKPAIQISNTNGDLSPDFSTTTKPACIMISLVNAGSEASNDRIELRTCRSTSNIS